METTTVLTKGDCRPDIFAEQRLWSAVIVNAVEDWLSGNLRDRREAQRFLFEDNTDFREVCAGAGLDPSSLRSRLLRVGRRVEMQGPLGNPLAA